MLSSQVKILTASFLCFCLAFLAVPFAHAGWKKAESKHFNVYSEGSEKDLYEYTVELEKLDALFRKLMQVNEGASFLKMNVILVRSDFNVRKFDRTASDNVAGFYTVGLRSAIAFVPRKNIGTSRFATQSEEILYHEYGHHIMNQYFSFAYPAWYIEGFAEFYSTVTFKDDGKIELGGVPFSRIPALDFLSIMPLDKMMFASNASRDDRFYPTSWLLTHFLTFDDERSGQLGEYLRAINSGVEHQKAATDSFGDIEELQKDLERYWRKRKLLKRIIGFNDFPDEFPVTTTVLPDDVDTLMEDYFVIQLHQYDDEDEDIIEDLNRSAAKALEKYPDSVFARYIMAEALTHQGKNEEAIKWLDDALSRDDKFIDAHILKANISMAMAQDADTDEAAEAYWAEMRSAVFAANKADHAEAVPLYYFYLISASKGDPIGDTQFKALEEAWYRFPQKTEYRVALFNQYLQRKEYRKAKLLIGPLLNDPHGRNGDQARALMDMLEERIAQDNEEEQGVEGTEGSNGSTSDTTDKAKDENQEGGEQP